MNIKLDYSDISFQNNGKLKLLIIVGTRPEIIRLAAVINKSRQYFDCILAHTGQNYDYNLNGVFFKDLQLADPEVYKRANLDRKLFSKIRKNKNYKPSKNTALALAIALELNLDETKDFIGKAGYALTRSSKMDIIVEFFIKQNNYDIFELNEVLFYYDEPLLGSNVA